MKTSPEAVGPASVPSPFWGLAAIVVAFIFVQGVDLAQNFDQRGKLQQGMVQMDQVLPNAATITQTLEDFTRDLAALAATSEEAKKIVAEHNIRVNAPAMSP
jgi:hypothetical protein